MIDNYILIYTIPELLYSRLNYNIMDANSSLLEIFFPFLTQHDFNESTRIEHKLD